MKELIEKPLSSLTDEELVGKITKGDREAFSILYHRYINQVYSYVYSRVGNKEEAENLTSEIFLKAYTNLESFEGKGSFKNWQYAIAKTVVCDYWRDKYKIPTVPLDNLLETVGETNNPEEDDDESTREKVWRTVKSLLERLPDNYRRVLELRFLKELSISETAEELKTSVENVKVMQHRALKKAANLGRLS